MEAAADFQGEAGHRRKQGKPVDHGDRLYDERGLWWG
jgi:hypothetical protein